MSVRVSTLPGAGVAVTLAAVPLALTQGLRVRRTTVRLPEAAERRGVVGDGPVAARVLVLGDSVAAGVGVIDHTESLAGQVTQGLANLRGEAVRWDVVARSGLTAAGVTRMAVSAQLAEADVVVVSVGVNDTKNLHSEARWRRELGTLLDLLLDAAPHAAVYVLGLPPMEQCPALPSPLSHVLGARTRRMDAVLTEVVGSRPRVKRVDPDVVGVDDLFAEDGFHPSATLHALAADAIVTDLASR